MRVVPVPLLADNYAYLVLAEDGVATAVVDPSEAEPVLAALQREGRTPTVIWLTHHHADHTGGVAGIVAAFPGIPVVASAYDGAAGRIEGQTARVDDADAFAFGPHEVRVLAVPGHTLGAVAYWVGHELFSGDTLFLAGCGRLFEGDPEMMLASLQKLRGLPAETRIWCGHEYAERNLAFAAALEPGRAAVAERIEAVRTARAAGEPSVPWTLREDAAVNPFLRFDDPALAAGETPLACFTRVRALRNTF